MYRRIIELEETTLTALLLKEFLESLQKGLKNRSRCLPLHTGYKVRYIG